MFDCRLEPRGPAESTLRFCIIERACRIGQILWDVSGVSARKPQEFVDVEDLEFERLIREFR